MERIDLSHSRKQQLSDHFRESEERFRKMIESSIDHAIIMVDLGGHIATWNQAAERLTGYDESEIIGQPLSRLLPEEDRGKAGEELAAAREHGRAESEGWRLRKDGSRFWGNEILSAMRDPGGELLGFTKVLRDLSARKQIEDALRESEERYRGLIESVRDYAIFRMDRAGIITTWNLGVARVLGYAQAEFIGKSGAIIFTKEDQARHQPEIEQRLAIERGEAPDERWHVKKDGTLFWASGVLTPVRNETGAVVGFSKLLRDNTETKTAQDALRRARAELENQVAQRTVELSQTIELLRGEIARRQHVESMLLVAIDEERQRFGQELHDSVCQHLAGTSLLVRSFEKRAQSGERITPEELSRVAQLLEQALTEIRGLAKGLHPVALKTGGLNIALQDLAALTSISVPCEFISNTRVDPEPHPALHLYRIAQEAVTNAVKHAHAHKISISLDLEDECYVLSVRDDGRGYEPARVVRGMGLHNIEQRAATIGGVLRQISKPGAGSQLTCTVPISRNGTV
jgi:PAS domain S-box-containing protein